MSRRNLHRALCLAGLVLSWSLPAVAQDIISSGQAPNSPGGTTFASGAATFDDSAPSLGGERIAFQGTLTIAGSITAANDTGLWSDGFGLQSNVQSQEGTAAFGAGGVLFGPFTGILNNPPPVNSGGQIAWKASLSGGGVVATNDTGLWTGVSLIAREGSAVPGIAGGLFGAFAGTNGDVLLGEGGHIAFHNTLTGVAANSDSSIWRFFGGTTALVARESDAAPGMPAGATFNGNFVTTNILLNDAGQVAFSAVTSGGGVTTENDGGIWRGTPGATSLVVREGTQIPGGVAGRNFSGINGSTPIGFNNAGQVAFSSVVTGLAAGVDEFLFGGDPSNLQTVAREGDAAPGTPAGTTFATGVNSLNPNLTGSGRVAFVAPLSGAGITAANDQGLWIGSRETTLKLIAREGAAAPGLAAGVVLGAMPSAFHANSDGQVVFSNIISGPGVTAANDQVIYASDPLGQLLQIYREGDSAPGGISGPFTKVSLVGGFSGGQDGRRRAINDTDTPGNHESTIVLALSNASTSVIKSFDTGSVIVGDQGNPADLTASDGGTYTIPRVLIVPAEGRTLTVSGGTTVNALNNKVVGGAGTGTARLTVSGAGTVLNGGDALGTFVESAGLLEVSNSATANLDFLGVSGDALTPAQLIVNGGTVNATNVLLGVGKSGSARVSGGGDFIAASQISVGELSFNAGTGTFTIDGVGSTVSAPLFSIGSGAGSQGTVSISGGGALAVLAGPINMARSDAMAQGALNISGSGSTVTTKELYVSGSAGSSGGTAVVNVAVGATLNVLETLAIRPLGTLNINGGTLAVPNLALPQGAFNFAFGTLELFDDPVVDDTTLDVAFGQGHVIAPGKTLILSGSPTINAPIVINGGTLSTGDLSTPSPVLFLAGTLNLTNSNLTIGPAGLFGSMLELNGDRTVNLTNLASSTTIHSGAQLTLSDGKFRSPTIINNGEIALAGSNARIFGNILVNNGLLRGNGHIESQVSNSATGEVRVSTGEFLSLTNLCENFGRISLLGGELHTEVSFSNEEGGLITGRGTLSAHQGIQNAGVMAFSGGFTDIIGDVTNGGGTSIVNSGGAIVTFYDDVVNQGFIRTSTGSRTVFFGAVSGAGTFSGTGSVQMEGDMLPGNSPALVSFGGDLTFGTLASLHVELGGTTAGTQYDRISVVGHVDVEGAPDAALINGFHPQTGDIFQVVEAGNLSGRFASVTGQDVGGSLLLNTVYSATGLSLLVAIPGDANLNGAVNFSDLGILLNSYNQSGVWTDGDFDNTDMVDFTDLGILLNHYNQVAPASATAAAVPEPNTLALAGLGAIGLLISARRKR